MYFTSYQRKDGFGAVFQNIIFDILYTEVNNNSYVFTDVKEFEHNYENKSDFTKNLNSFMNLKNTYINPDNYEVKSYKLIETYSAVQENINKYFNSPSFQKLKEVFLSNKTSPYSNDYHNVAIHIRKKNKGDENYQNDFTYSFRLTETSYYTSVITKIKESYNGNKPLKFHIYSQGVEDEFSEYKSLGVNIEFHLNKDIEETFLRLVFSDILVISKSSFSYTAAFFCSGVVIYKKFWHPPLFNWISLF